jgi:hypothetical protein
LAFWINDDFSHKYDQDAHHDGQRVTDDGIPRYDGKEHWQNESTMDANAHAFGGQGYRATNTMAAVMGKAAVALSKVAAAAAAAATAKGVAGGSYGEGGGGYGKGGGGSDCGK